MRGLNYKTRFIDLAGEVNTEMPLFWVRKVAAALNDIGRAVRASSVLVIGVAYKRDIDDLRESPALDIIRLLEAQGATVNYHDPLRAGVHGGRSPTHLRALDRRRWSPRRIAS